MIRTSHLLALGLFVLAHLALFAPLPIFLQSVAALTLTILLPGFFLVEALVGHGAAPPGPWERSLYVIGAGFGLLVIVMLAVSYLPGPATRTQTLLAFDATIAAFFVWGWLASRKSTPNPGAEWKGLDGRWVLAGALILGLVGATFRFANLGYTDFQGDEARAALRAAAVLQGYEDVLMLHKKGPTEILAPAAFYALTGHLNEATARLPFALASFAALFAIWLLGWRIFNPLAGWTAAMFLALDGYFIGFSRIVQYQSVVLLMSLLAVLILARLLKTPRAFTAYLSLAALFLATGALSHYEGVLAGLPVALLWGALLWRQRQERRALVAATLVAVAVGGVILAFFYLPFVLNPRFVATYTYLADRRIGSSFPYNNLADVFLRTTLYSTTYYVLLLVGLTVAAMIRVWRAGWPRWFAWALSLAAVVVFGLTFFNSQWLLMGATDWTFLPFALLLGMTIVAPGQRAETRSLWLWFGAVMLLAIFFTEKPRTHVYTFFIPWFLLTADTLAAGWFWLRERAGYRAAVWVGAIGAATAILLFANYAYWYFLSTDEVVLDYFEKRPAGYWVAYGEPDNKARFGFPLNNGWKVIGELYRQGVLSGPFDSSEKGAWVPAWYTRGAERCSRDAQWFFEIRNLEPFSNKDQRNMEDYLRRGFVKQAVVQVNGRDKLIIYERSGERRENPTQDPTDGLPVYDLASFAASFDENSAPDLPLTYPSVDPPIANPLHINFGDLIWLEGYAVDYPQPLTTNDAIRLTLYWRAQRPIEEDYKVFNQVYFGDSPMIAQRDGFPVCESRDTSQWDPGELITDSYLIPINPDAPDGLYRLHTGFYLEESGERLSVLDETGAEIDSQVHLTDIRIGEE